MTKPAKTVEERLDSLEKLLDKKCQDCGALTLDATKHRLFHDQLKVSLSKKDKPFQGGFR
jgi:hypothetical protein